MKNKPRWHSNILWTCAITLVIAGVAWCIHADYYKHKEPPPQYSEVLCDGRGHYGVKMPGGTLLYGKDEGDGYFTSRQQAINRAWRQYNFHHDDPSESKTSDFKGCGKFESKTQTKESTGPK